ncbi:MAG: hypothetical protein U0Y68_18125 [Blastocatellia bacterium]
MKTLIWLIVAILVPVPWVILVLTGQSHALPPVVVTTCQALQLSPLHLS